MVGKVRDRKEYYQKNKDAFQKRADKWAKENPEKRLIVVLKSKLKKFDATLKDYLDKTKEQEHCCGICKEPFANVPQFPDIDHDHETNKFRGLLCRKCNLGLGYFKDNEEILLSAVCYLRNAR